jgi:hypothetical protein
MMKTLLFGALFTLLFAASAGAQETGSRFQPGAGVCMSGGIISACLPFKGPTGSSYAILATDNFFRVKIDRNGATIPRAGIPTGFPANWQIEIINSDSVAAPLTTTVSIFKGANNASAINLTPGTTAFLQSDGTDYQTKLIEYVQAVPHTWTKQNSLPPCPLTDAATIAIDATSCAVGPAYGVGLFTVTLSGNGHNVPLPAGLVDGQTFGLRFTQGTTGGFSVNFASGYKFPGGTPITLSTATGSVDEIWCHGFGGSTPSFVSTEADCGSPNLNVQSTSSTSGTITVTAYQEGNCGSAAVTSCASSPYNVTSGHRYIVFPTLCGATTCSTGTTATASSVSGSANLGACSLVTGTQSAASRPIKAEIWTCLATGTGSTTITAQFNATVFWAGVGIVDAAGLSASPDDGVGNTASGSNTSLSVGLAGLGSTQTNELIIGYAAASGEVGMTAGTGYTLVPGSNTILYSIVNSPGTNTATATEPNNSGGAWWMALAALKHP